MIMYVNDNILLLSLKSMSVYIIYRLMDKSSSDIIQNTLDINFLYEKAISFVVTANPYGIQSKLQKTSTYQS